MTVLLAVICIVLLGLIWYEKVKRRAMQAILDVSPVDEDRAVTKHEQIAVLKSLGWQEPTDLAYYQQQYLGDASLPVHHISDGDYYLIIPRGPGADVKLYQTDPESGDWTLLYEEADCGPFLLQCNVSDIFPDAVVSVSRDGLCAEFSPYLSLEDGSVQAGDLGLDLTRTPPAEEASSAG